MQVAQLQQSTTSMSGQTAATRTRGAVIMGLGLVLAVGMAATVVLLMPSMLRMREAGHVWSNTPGQFYAAVALMSVASALGAAFTLAGWQLRQRGQIALSGRIALGAVFAALALSFGYFQSQFH